MKNAKFWLAMAVAFDAIGFFSRFFGVLADGARVFGRGCDLQCSNDVVILFTTSALFLALALLSAIYSIYLARMQSGRIIITILGVLAGLIAVIFCRA
ncbi:hypothetical protein [Hafnia alvei]|uniref:Uncharacterized protein n=1 Tax=Hafnia alvei ATCC 51873 TaxID=1002364 RepID=G9Y1S6_HAFAL|nr:hypothetical protein [Hafnia alvei]EHM47796.1 hypothetical protein HMPREF0454_00493 [Hafnia alvei ATCC 51873]QQE44869.1 hypothetical protein I6H95_06095 [Hafnia alvei]